MSVLNQLTDEELMKSYQDGNELAFEVLYRRHSGKVNGFLRGKLRDTALADDVFQSTFLKLHQTRQKFDPSFPFIPWLFTVCRSAMVDSVRKRNRIQEVMDSSALERAVSPEVESAALMFPDLSALPANQKKALELRYENDLSFEEIAKRLETTPSNVRQVVSRAIKKLKTLALKSEGEK